MELLVVMSGLEMESESPLVEQWGRQVEMKGLLDPMAALLMELMELMELMDPMAALLMEQMEQMDPMELMAALLMEQMEMVV